MAPLVTIDARRAIVRMSAMPEQVLTNLRRLLPRLAKTLGAEMEANMSARLQSHNRLKITKLLVENPRNITAIVRFDWTGEAAKKLVPTYLEYGTKPHVIEAKNANVLAFFWPKIDGWFFGRRVNHPGNKPYQIVKDAWDAQKGIITAEITATVKRAAKGQP